MKCPMTSCPQGDDFCERQGCIALGFIKVSGRMTDEDHAETQSYYDAIRQSFDNIAAAFKQAGDAAQTVVMAAPMFDCITYTGKCDRRYKRFMRKAWNAYNQRPRPSRGWRRHVRRAA